MIRIDVLMKTFVWRLNFLRPKHAFYNYFKSNYFSLQESESWIYTEFSFLNQFFNQKQCPDRRDETLNWFNCVKTIYQRWTPAWLINKSLTHILVKSKLEPMAPNHSVIQALCWPNIAEPYIVFNWQLLDPMCRICWHSVGTSFNDIK